MNIAILMNAKGTVPNAPNTLEDYKEYTIWQRQPSEFPIYGMFTVFKLIFQTQITQKFSL